MAGPKKTDRGTASAEETTPAGTPAAGVVVSNEPDPAPVEPAAPAATPDTPVEPVTAPASSSADTDAVRAQLAEAAAQLASLREENESLRQSIDARDVMHQRAGEKAAEVLRSEASDAEKVAFLRVFFGAERDPAASVPAPKPQRFYAVGSIVLVIDGKRVEIHHNDPIPEGFDVSKLAADCYREGWS